MTSTDTAQLTRAEEAYAHLASFKHRDLVTVGGRCELPFTAGVITPQKHDHADINRAYLVVASNGKAARITVASLLSGRYTITARTAQRRTCSCGEAWADEPGHDHDTQNA